MSCKLVLFVYASTMPSYNSDLSFFYNSQNNFGRSLNKLNLIFPPLQQFIFSFLKNKAEQF